MLLQCQNTINDNFSKNSYNFLISLLRNSSKYIPKFFYEITSSFNANTSILNNDDTDWGAVIYYVICASQQNATLKQTLDSMLHPHYNGYW